MFILWLILIPDDREETPAGYQDHAALDICCMKLFYPRSTTIPSPMIGKSLKDLKRQGEGR
jgi:hypothetical protein